MSTTDDTTTDAGDDDGTIGQRLARAVAGNDHLRERREQGINRRRIDRGEAPIVPSRGRSLCLEERKFLDRYGRGGFEPIHYPFERR